MSDEIRISGIVEESIVDGPGLRYVLFTQGCPHHCKGCHNPTTHPFDGGRMVSPDWVFADVRKNPIVRGVTFSGGEPFVQSGKLAPLAERLRVAVRTGGGPDGPEHGIDDRIPVLKPEKEVG